MPEGREVQQSMRHALVTADLSPHGRPLLAIDKKTVKYCTWNCREFE